MNFDQAKALRLQQWRSTLDDQEFRLQYPEVHRYTLHTISHRLAAEGLIDKLEQFDMDEMANAAYWHAVEEIQGMPPHYCAASTYDVLVHQTGHLFGRISRSIFYFARSLTDPNRSGYDGKILQDATGATLTFEASRGSGKVTGLTLTMPDGEVYCLVETKRAIDGVIYEPIEDPDIYRVLVDVAQVAMENRNLRTFEKVRPLLDLSRFRTCPDCLDQFGQKDDCSTCTGKGFVTKPTLTGPQ